jgi:hypothetical protein
MTFKKTFRQIAATIGLAAMTGSAAFAGFNQGDSVTFNGQPVFAIKGSAEGFSPEKRAWQAQDALDNALFLSQNPGPGSVSVNKRNGAFTLELGGHYVATADENSAKAEGMCAANLADKWANQLRDALSDSQKTQDYIATLKTPNQLEGSKIAFERKIFAPEGTILPVSFNQELEASNLTPGQSISGKIIQNVPVGNYFIPANSVLLGNVFESQPGIYQVRISTLRTPSGTIMPVNAVLSDTRYQAISTAPHPVATVGMPANSTTGTRVPAIIGLGTRSGKATAMILSKDNGCSIACGQPATVILEKVQSVAVVPGGPAM